MKPLFALALLLIIFFPRHLLAAAVTIDVIEPSGVTADDEYIDLINNSESAVAIGTWSIQYKSAAGATFYKKNFPASTSIAAQSRYRIGGSGYAGTIPADMKQSSFSLAANGGTVFLVGAQALISSVDDPNIVDQKTYGPTETVSPTPPPSPTHTSPQPLRWPSEGGMNTTTPLQMLPIKISIHSFLADPPTGEKEWVMLMNDSTYGVELAGWTIADGTGKTVAKPVGLILPGATYKVELPVARLNNDGDHIVLCDPTGREVDSKTYGSWNELTESATSTVKNQSLNSLDYNAILARVVKEIASAIQNARNEQRIVIENIVINFSGDSVAPVPAKTKTATTVTTPAKKTAAPKPKAKTATPTISGTVIVAANTLWKGIPVVRTKTESIQLHLPAKTNLSLAVGDVITASGTWSTAKTLPLPRLLVKSDAAVRVTEHVEVGPPIPVTLAETPTHVGELIEVQGPVIQKQPTRVRVATGNNSVLVPTEKTDVVKVDDTITARGLLTRDGDDFKLLAVAPNSITVLPRTKTQSRSLPRTLLPYALALAPAGILSGAVYWGRRRKQQPLEKGGDANG